MQGLEKILEEMRGVKDGNRKEKLYAKYPPNGKDQEVLNAYSQGYEDGTDNFYNAVLDIIRKYMTGGKERWRTREIELKPCPFCGGEAVIHVDDGVCVVCRKCNSRTISLVDGISQGKPNGGAIYSVVEKWNKRITSND